MLDLIEGWNKVDNENEEKVYKKIIFKRPITFDYCSIYCNKCKNVISSIEDVESMKKHKVCESCFLSYS